MCVRAEDEIIILIVLVTGNRFSRARDSIVSSRYTRREDSTPLYARTIRIGQTRYVTHPSPSGDLGYWFIAARKRFLPFVRKASASRSLIRGMHCASIDSRDGQMEKKTERCHLTQVRLEATGDKLTSRRRWPSHSGSTDLRRFLGDEKEEIRPRFSRCLFWLVNYWRDHLNHYVSEA